MHHGQHPTGGIGTDLRGFAEQHGADRESRQAMLMEAIQQVADRDRQVIVSLMGPACAESIRRPEHTMGIEPVYRTA